MRRPAHCNPAARCRRSTAQSGVFWLHAASCLAGLDIHNPAPDEPEAPAPDRETPARPVSGKRPLPQLTRWATGLWAFAHASHTYFVSRLSDGWTVVDQEQQTVPLVSGHKARAAAVRAALDLLDQAART